MSLRRVATRSTGYSNGEISTRPDAVPVGTFVHLKRGFTSIELLVTLAILAILAAVSIPAIGRAKVSAKKAACQSNLRQVNFAVRLYTDDEGKGQVIRGVLLEE